MNFRPAWFLAAATLLAAGCHRSTTHPATDRGEPVSQGSTGEYRAVSTYEASRERLVDYLAQAIDGADLSILVMGNSHTHTGDPLGQLEHLLKRSSTDKKIFMHARRGSFLSELGKQPKNRDAISAGPWDYVILQAQKYSTSGNYHYPTDAAIELGNLARHQGAKVIMFPEWPRRGNQEEGSRIHQLHQSIARKLDAQVAPIGLAWIRARHEYAQIELYANDGNHSSRAGAGLTAAVLFSVITDTNPAEVDAKPIPTLSPAQSKDIRQLAWQVCREANQASD